MTPRKQLDDITHALVALAKIVPDVHSVTVHMFIDKPTVRFSCKTQDGFDRLANTFDAKISTVGIDQSEWEIGEAKIDEHVSIEVSGSHRQKRKHSDAPVKLDAEAVATAIAKAEQAWEGDKQS